MSSAKLIITEHKNCITGFLMKDLKADRIFIDDSSEFRVGSVFVGKVKKVKKDIGAAFVDINDGVSCFLPFDEIFPEGFCNRSYDGRILEGDEVCVMVQKESVKTKLSALSMHIEIPGTYCVAVMDSDSIHASSKLSSDVSNSLCTRLSKDLPKGTGIILRTNAANAEYEDVLAEAQILTDKLNEIKNVMKSRKVYSKLFEAKPSYISRIDDIPKDSYDEIVTDSETIHKELTSFYKDRSGEIRLYRDENLSLKSLYCIERAISDATSKNVYLPCGGYLVIEPTEALTVIDVNSGKVTSGKNPDDNYDLVNREAAVEIARQLRLRNIFGIIIVDFINYKDKEKEKQLLSLLRHELSADYSSAKVCSMTSLGLVEITRAKKYGSVYDYKKVFDK